ncbi:MAG: glycosyltransferase [Opitutae bacterium]
MSQIVQIGLDVTSSAGGSATAFHAVRNAIGGKAISFTGQSRWNEILEGDGIHHIQTDRSLLGRFFHKPNPQELARAKEILHGAKLLIIHTLYRYHAHWAHEISRELSIPYWVIIHGGLDPYVLSYRRFRKMHWLKQFGRLYLRNAQKVIFATSNEQAKASPFLDGVQSRVVPWPVECPQVPNVLRARQLWRNKLGIEDDARLLLFLGRLQEVKQPLAVLDAFRQARAPDTHLVFAGPSEGNSPAEILHLARSMSIPHVHAVGPVYKWDKDGLLAASDGLISLSVKENFNFAAAEAMAAQKPVILSPGNDLQGELLDLPCGWLLGTDEIHQAARAIYEFSTFPKEQLAKFGITAGQWAANNLGPNTFKKRFDSLLAEL